ncbi:MAG TPA: ribonuclease J [Thermohalobaculum sp.]|nr:ribonuclease J [Thermohalobaculum sp.]
MSQKTGPLVYCALGGAGEIGMNCYMYGLGDARARRWIMVDLGIGFGDMETAPGVELVLPDISFAVEERDSLEGIFITHAHEDHIGAIPHLWRKLKLPIHARPFTAEVIRRKMHDAGLDPFLIKTVETGERVAAGPFEVEFLPTTHSIPEASMLAIRTGHGTIVHTGDFKTDRDPQIGPPFDLAALERLGDEGVLALMCDSTNVFAAGEGGSEADVVQTLARLIAKQPKAVAATTFASNIVRLRTLARAAEAAGRSVVVAGRAMQRMIQIGTETGIVSDFPPILRDSQADDIPRENLFYLVSGSQAENRAALARIAGGSHPTVELKPDDTVLFSSKNIPGNEAGIARLQNRLSEQGIRVIDSDMERIHVSGHARREDLRAVTQALRPSVAVPIHGEHRHLVEHASAALGWGVPHTTIAPNGAVVRLDGDVPGVVEHVETGRIFLDGTAHVGSHDGVIRERLRMARLGHVIVSVIVDEEGDLLADPDVRCLGAPKDGEGWPAPLEEMIAQSVDDAIEDTPRKNRRTDGPLEELILRAARRITGRYWGKKPVTTVMIARLEE